MLKSEVANRLETYLNELESQHVILAVCAGKASSATRTPEKSALCGRWTTRYGTDRYQYTGLRRLYADTGACTDYKTREAVALQVETHVFELLRARYKKKEDADKVAFSTEEGRKNMGATHGPPWAVFVYLAFKVMPCEQ
jgi:hypothetical protein